MHIVKPKRPEWPIKESIFYSYITKEEDQSIVQKCFLKDWDDMKKLKYKKCKEAEVKKVAEQYYRVIKDAYRVQAGLSSAGTVISVPLNQYTVFLQELDLIDNFNFKQADADRMFIAINTFFEGKREALNPANSLVRYQLLELIVRVAMEKYPLMPTEALSLEKICEEHLLPKIQSFPDQCKWRRQTTLNEQVDNVVKAYKPVFKHLYKEYGGKIKKGGHR